MGPIGRIVVLQSHEWLYGGFTTEKGEIEESLKCEV